MTQPGFSHPIPPVAPFAVAEAIDEVTGDDSTGDERADERDLAPGEVTEQEPTIVRSPDLERELSADKVDDDRLVDEPIADEERILGDDRPLDDDLLG